MMSIDKIRLRGVTTQVRELPSDAFVSVVGEHDGFMLYCQMDERSTEKFYFEFLMLTTGERYEGNMRDYLPLGTAFSHHNGRMFHFLYRKVDKSNYSEKEW